MLVYPVCDNESGKYASVENYKDAVWSKKANKTMWKTYLKQGTKNIAYVVPIKSDLRNLPPAYIEPQEIDILRDEVVAYADKLKAVGVAVEVNKIPGSYLLIFYTNIVGLNPASCATLFLVARILDGLNEFGLSTAVADEGFFLAVGGRDGGTAIWENCFGYAVILRFLDGTTYHLI